MTTPIRGRHFDRPGLLRRLHALGWIDRPTAEAAVATVTDAELASVLSIYNRQNGIPGGGELRPETERSLAEVRFCAHPDVMPMQEELAAWPAGTLITWAFTGGPGFSGLTPGEAKAAFEEATAAWMAVCGVRFQYTGVLASAMMAVETAAIDGPAGTLAWSELANGRATQKRQRYDQAEAWVSAAAPQRYQIDLVRVATHEIGHLLGIGHIAAGNLLQPTYDPQIRGPQAGDIREAQARYGPPQAPPPPPPPPAGRTVITLEVDGAVAGVTIPGFRVTKL